VRMFAPQKTQQQQFAFHSRASISQD
jgi:hypothetical protein